MSTVPMKKNTGPFPTKKISLDIPISIINIHFKSILNCKIFILGGYSVKKYGFTNKHNPLGHHPEINKEEKGSMSNVKLEEELTLEILCTSDEKIS